MKVSEYRAHLKTLSKDALLQLLYKTKRAKYPKKHALIEEALKQKLVDPAREETIKNWVASLVGTSIVLRGHAKPVKILEAQLNSRGNAAIVRLEGETHTRYLEYKEQRNDE